MPRRRTHRITVLVLAAGLVLGPLASACSSDPPDPAEVRRDRVEDRLRESFSAAQARCILRQVDATVLRALDRTVALDPTTEAMTAYSEAVAACVADPDTPAPAGDDARSTTTSAPG